jgi:GTPase SAR1 family protein
MHGDDDKVMIFKLLMVGPHAVGKTTVVHYVSKGKFTNVLTTVGLEFASKSWTFDRHPTLGRVTINAEITDIQGQDRGKASLNRFMARNTKAVICVTCHPVDNTKLEELEDWFLATQNALSGASGYDDLKFYILINKSDLVDNTEKARGEELVRRWIASHKGKDSPSSSGQKMDAEKILGFTSCSAKTGTNLPKAVTSFVEGVVKTCPESDFAQPLTSAPTYAPPISAIQKRDSQKKQCQC